MTRYFVVRKETRERHRQDHNSQPQHGFSTMTEAVLFMHDKMLDPSKWEVELVEDGRSGTVWWPIPVEQDAQPARLQGTL